MPKRWTLFQIKYKWTPDKSNEKKIDFSKTIDANWIEILLLISALIVLCIVLGL